MAATLGQKKWHAMARAKGSTTATMWRPTCKRKEKKEMIWEENLKEKKKAMKKKSIYYQKIFATLIYKLVKRECAFIEENGGIKGVKKMEIKNIWKKG